MMYASLGIDLILVIVLIVLGLVMIKKGAAKIKNGRVGKVTISDTSKKPLKPMSEVSDKKGKDMDKKDSGKPLDKNLAYLKKCRDRGMLDHQIAQEFVKSGWKEKDAEKLVKDNP